MAMRSRARQISTNWRPRDVGIPMRFQRQVYVRQVARQLSRACIKRPLAHNTCERATPMPTRRKCPRPTIAVPPHYVKCFPEYLRMAGYYCTNNTKTDYQFTPPITAWDELSAQAHWRNRPDGAPFFAVFNRTVTHESGMWPEKRPEVETDPDSVTLPPLYPQYAQSAAGLGAALRQHRRQRCVGWRNVAAIGR